MENHLSDKINCCFCDKNLSPCDKDTTTKPIKYKCPACERIYCSAKCSQLHKDIFECSGVRERTPYVPLSKFDQKQFLDDYFFLEAVNNKVEYAQRVFSHIKRPVLPGSHQKKKVKNSRKKKSKGPKKQSEPPTVSSKDKQSCPTNST